jgi:hypothetical protein
MAASQIKSIVTTEPKTAAKLVQAALVESFAVSAVPEENADLLL